jgi:hypothetical protein
VLHANGNDQRKSIIMAACFGSQGALNSELKKLKTVDYISSNPRRDCAFLKSRRTKFPSINDHCQTVSQKWKHIHFSFIYMQYFSRNVMPKENAHMNVLN